MLNVGKNVNKHIIDSIDNQIIVQLFMKSFNTLISKFLKINLIFYQN